MLLSHLHQKPETPEPFCTKTRCHSLRPFCLCILCTCVWIIATVDDNYCNILCLTCLQVQTLIDNDSNLNFCVFSPRIIVPPQHLSHAHYMCFAASSLCHVSVLAIKFFIHAWTGWLLHCYDHVKWTAENGYVENSMWCARWEEEWENSNAFQFHVFQSQHFLSGVHGWNFACKSYSIAYSLTNGVCSKQGSSSTISRLTQCSGGSSSVVIFIPVLLAKSIRSINFDRYVRITFFFFFLKNSFNLTI